MSQERKLTVKGKEWGWHPGRTGVKVRPPEGVPGGSTFIPVAKRGEQITPGLVKKYIDMRLEGKMTEQAMIQATQEAITAHETRRVTCDGSEDKEHCSCWPDFGCCYCG